MAGEVFISYRRSDLAKAERFVELLKAEGVEAWYDAQVGAGQDWRQATARALSRAHIFVLLFSKAAAASDDIAKELAAATFSKKLIVPVRLENIQPEGSFLYELASRNWINAYEDTDLRLTDLAKSLAVVVKQGARPDSVVGFDHTPSLAPRRPVYLRSRRRILGAGAAALVLCVLVAAVALFGGGRERPVPGRIAFFGIDVPSGDKDAAAVAAAASSDILSTLSAFERDVAASADTEGTPTRQRLDRALQLRAAYAVSGTLSRRGEELLLSIRVEDVPSRASLWSDPVQGPASDPAAIAIQAAALLTDKLNCVITVRASLIADDPRIMARLPEACESIRIQRPGYLERWRELAELAPNSAWILANEAFAVLNAIPDAPPTVAGELASRAEVSLRRAERIDPHSPDVARARVAEARSHSASLAEIEKLFLDGLRVAPNGSNLVGGYSAFLFTLGRQQESIVYGRQAYSLDPLSAPKMLGIGGTLAHAGFPAEAEALYKRRHVLFPDSMEWQNHVIDAMFKNVGDVDAVLLDSPASVSTQTRNCLKEIVRLGRQAAQVARREAARRAAECIEIGAMDLTRGNEVRAFLGDYEGIFAFGVPNPGMFYSEIQNPFRSFMFDPLLTGLRADKRFADMMRSSGLLEYWRETGRHPDFCETENVQVCALINSK